MLDFFVIYETTPLTKIYIFINIVLK